MRTIILKNIRAGMEAGTIVFALWGIVEPFIPLTRFSGVTHLPFLSLSPLVAYGAVSVAVYAVLGAVAGALVGCAGGFLFSLRRPRAPLPATAAARVYGWVLLWGILSFAALYYVNRLVPGSYRSPRSLRMSLVAVAAVTLAGGLALATDRLLARRARGQVFLASAGRRIRQAMLLIVIASLVTTGLLRGRELFARPGGRAAAAAGSPDVILICVDALRPDHLSAYGYPLPTSPAMDELAREGVLFTSAYCQAPSSTPSHASMFTGLYPTAHGAVTNGDLLRDDVLTAAELFGSAGYATAAFLTNPWLSRQFGFAQGFEFFVESGILQQADRTSIGQFAGNLFVAQVWGKLRGQDLSCVRALSWVRAHRHERFFLFLHLLDPHGPYTPPDDLYRLFLPTGTDEAARTVAAYDGEVRVADEKVGRLVKTLDKLGLRRNTIICLTSDHGENMAEHGQPFAHGTFYESSIRVPLILTYPGALPAGRRVPYPVETIDILPTLLGLARLSPAVDGEGQDLTALVNADGASRPDRVGPTGPADPAQRPVFAQRSHIYMIRRGDWKLIWDIEAAEPELYNLARDPGELEKIPLTREPAAAQELMSTLKTWMDRENARARVPVSRLQELDAATIQRLKALGYLR